MATGLGLIDLSIYLYINPEFALVNSHDPGFIDGLMVFISFSQTSEKW